MVVTLLQNVNLFLYTENKLTYLITITRARIKSLNLERAPLSDGENSEKKNTDYSF